MRWPALAMAILVAGCASGDGSKGTTGAPSGPAPNGVPEDPTGLALVATADGQAALGFWLHEGLAYVSGPSGLRIVDLHDPAAPTVLASEVPGTQSSRDVDLLVHPNGRTYAVMSFNAPRIALVDVTDPTMPFHVGDAPTGNSHTVAVVPNSTVVYVSQSVVVGQTPGLIDVVDYADPAAPSVSAFRFPLAAATVDGGVKPVTATTCHEITFEPLRSWALCSGVTETHVWDVTDPLAPTILQVIDWPGTNIHHSAWSAHGGDLLLIGDEFAGVLVPTPTCTGPAPLPTSAVWFFDTSDLGAPMPLGYFQTEHNAATADGAYCSTHLGDVLEGRDLLAIGWYSAGAVLVDFSDPAAPREVARYTPGGSAWEARFLGGHVVVADSLLGLQVLAVEGGAA